MTCANGGGGATCVVPGEEGAARGGAVEGLELQVGEWWWWPQEQPMRARACTSVLLSGRSRAAALLLATQSVTRLWGSGSCALTGPAHEVTCRRTRVPVYRLHERGAASAKRAPVAVHSPGKLPESSIQSARGSYSLARMIHSWSLCISTGSSSAYIKAGTYWAPEPMAVFHMEVEAKGQRNLHEGVGGGGGGGEVTCRGKRTSTGGLGGGGG